MNDQETPTLLTIGIDCYSRGHFGSHIKIRDNVNCE